MRRDVGLCVGEVVDQMQSSASMANDMPCHSVQDGHGQGNQRFGLGRAGQMGGWQALSWSTHRVRATSGRVRGETKNGLEFLRRGRSLRHSREGKDSE